MVIDANLLKGLELGFGVGLICGLLLSACVGVIILWQWGRR